MEGLTKHPPTRFFCFDGKFVPFYTPAPATFGSSQDSVSMSIPMSWVVGGEDS